MTSRFPLTVSLSFIGFCDSFWGALFENIVWKTVSMINQISCKNTVKIFSSKSHIQVYTLIKIFPLSLTFLFEGLLKLCAITFVFELSTYKTLSMEVTGGRWRIRRRKKKGNRRRSKNIKNIVNENKIKGDISTKKKHFLVEELTCQFSNRTWIPTHTHTTH